MYFTMQEIKELIKNDYDTITEDTLDEIADSITPVYYSEIIKDWAEMPSHFNDSWRDLGLDETGINRGILELMRFDLFAYNSERVREIWETLEGEATE